MKHANAEMIKAVVDNLELVIFFKETDDARWFKTNINSLVNACSTTDYFLCLPQRKEACLHWLNGGDVQLDHFDQPMPNSGVNGNCHLVDFDEDVNSLPWKLNHPFMDEAQEIRIKPKKEKRWIAVNPDGYVMPIHADSIESARAHACHDTTRLTLGVQYIEIEVEV